MLNGVTINTNEGTSMNKFSITAIVAIACMLPACNDKVPPWSEAPVTQASVEVAVVPWTASAGAIDSGHCKLDTVNGQHPAEGIISVASQQPVTLQGWVATADLKNPVNFTFVLDGIRDFGIQASTSLPRDDVAKNYDSGALVNSGFKIDVAAATIPKGNYRVKIAYRAQNGNVACDTGVKIDFI